jgi:hypothetical protein
MTGLWGKSKTVISYGGGDCHEQIHAALCGAGNPAECFT